jgi:peptide/nickel transport system permease protein
MTTQATIETGSPATVPGRQPASGRRRLPSLLRQPLGLISVIYLVLLVTVGVFAPLVSPYDPNTQDLEQVLSGPTSAHLLGTDALGQDVLSRLLYGILPSLQNSLIALVVFLIIGVPIGVLAGYRGGRLDSVVGRIAELVLSIPPIILVLVVLAVFSASPTAAMITLGVLAAPGLIRVVRGATLAVREELFITSAKVSGVGPLRIMITHVLPQVRGPILAQATVFAGITLAFQAALAFLGLLASSGRPTWGGMIGDAAQVITQDAWLLFPPGILLALTVLAFGLLGDTIRDLTATEAVAPPARKRDRRPPARTINQPAADFTESDPDALLSVRGLQISAGPTVLVDDATFTIYPGQTVAVVGESGCGKSVTALAVLGLLPTGVSVTGGQVIFNGTDLTAGGPKAYRTVRGSGIAYVAQDALGSLDPTHSIGDHLVEVIGLHDKGTKAAARRRALQLLQQVRITDPERVLRTYPHQVSGGMAQRVNIAIALAGRPQLLIADEPTTALDVTVQSEILRLLHELRDSTGMAILLITHDWGVVADIADHATVMYAGEVVESNEITRLFSAPRFPYTAALLAADPGLAEKGTRLPTVAGRVPAPGAWPTGCRFAGRCTFTTEACTTAPIPLMMRHGALTRCIRVDDLVEEGALPR